MAGKISFECPACSTKLSVSDSGKLGKKIKCPKFKEVFMPEVVGDDEIEDFEDDVEDKPKVPSSKKRGSGGGKGSKKGNSSSGGSSLPLVIGGVVVVIGAAENQVENFAFNEFGGQGIQKVVFLQAGANATGRFPI